MLADQAIANGVRPPIEAVVLGLPERDGRGECSGRVDVDAGEILRLPRWHRIGSQVPEGVGDDLADSVRTRGFNENSGREDMARACHGNGFVDEDVADTARMPDALKIYVDRYRQVRECGGDDWNLDDRRNGMDGIAIYERSGLSESRYTAGKINVLNIF
jgi:hypothetical protein